MNNLRVLLAATVLLPLSGILEAIPCAAQASGPEGEPVVIGHRVTVPSQILDEDRQILIHLPDGYGRSSARYPVLYLLDGSFHFHHVTGLTRFLSAIGRAPAMIVVGIDNTDRTRDLTPPATADSARMRLPFSSDSVTLRHPTAGGADAFLRFITHELVPFVESGYRAAHFRILAGHSFGGLFVTHALLTQPESFHGYIASSPSLWWNGGAVAASAAEQLDGREVGGRFFYGSVADGEADMIPPLAQLTEAFEGMRPAGLRWWYRVLTNETHSTVSHRSFEEGLVAIFGDWPISDAPIFAGNLSAVEAHFASVSKLYGHEFPVPEDLVNQMGYLQLQIGRGERALPIFRRNVELYPASANVYDSLADALEPAGERHEALRNRDEAVRRAEEIGDDRLEVFRRKRDALRERIAQGRDG
jgi:uncharacterized protein